MNVDDVIQKKWGKLDYRRNPVEIPNVGRADLAELFHDLNFKVGAEIGTERGLYAETLCYRNPGLELYCIDPWRTYKGYREHVTQEKLDEIRQHAETRLAPYKVKIIAYFSDVAINTIPDNYLDFVYIDANHEYQHVVNDICNWSRKVRAGGIVSGHDFCRRKESGYQVHVVEAVGGYTSAYFINPWYVLGRKAQVPGEVRDTPRSWFWIKD